MGEKMDMLNPDCAARHRKWNGGNCMKRMTALVLALLLALSVFPALADDFSYPMEPITLTINMAEDTTVVPDYAKDYYFWDLLDDKTGVTLEYTGAAFP